MCRHLPTQRYPNHRQNPREIGAGYGIFFGGRLKPRIASFFAPDLISLACGLTPAQPRRIWRLGPATAATIPALMIDAANNGAHRAFKMPDPNGAIIDRGISLKLIAPGDRLFTRGTDQVAHRLWTRHSCGINLHQRKIIIAQRRIRRSYADLINALAK